MNEQPEALRLADAMLNYWDERGPDAEAVAAELRRLHEVNEAFGKRQEWWNDRMFELEAALRQALSPQWQGLTDEQFRELADEHLFYQPEGYEVSGVFNFARAIEAKLKEKNDG